MELFVRIKSLAPAREASNETSFQTAASVLKEPRHHKANVPELEVRSVLDLLSEFIFRTWCLVLTQIVDGVERLSILIFFSIEALEHGAFMIELLVVT